MKQDPKNIIFNNVFYKYHLEYHFDILFNMLGNDLNDTWLSFFELKNVTIINTDLTCQDNIDLQEDNTGKENDLIYNAFKI